MYHNQRIGKFGEELARKYLIGNGYKIIDQNVKTSFKEIDIIAEENDELVFVEVKTRTSLMFGGAEEALTPAKINNFKKGVELYLIWRDYLDNKEIRLDLISVDIGKDKKTAKIKHYKDIF